jgi:peroxiredoxin
VPETFIIDKNGSIVQLFPLPIDETRLSAAVENALSIE